MKTNKKLILVILTIIIIISLSACQVFPKEENTEKPSAVIVDDTIVSATGVLTPEFSAYLSIASTGIVDQVLIQEGQFVSEGQELVVLSGQAQVQAALAAAELEYEAAQQSIDELNENADLARADAWLVLLEAKQAYINAEEAWEELDVDALEDDIDDAQEEVLDLENDLEEAQDRYDSYADLGENNSLKTMYEDELTEAQEAYNEKVRARDALIVELKTYEAAWQAALAARDKAQVDYDDLLNGPDPDQLATAKTRLDSAAAQIDAALEQIENLTLTAPFSGIVTELMISEGEWTSPGQPVIVLADLDSLRVETTDLNEIDVVQIEVGEKAEVTFDAIPDKIFEGTIIEISSKASEGTGVNYTVVIKLAKIPESARWGMTAFVDIDTQQ